MMCMSSNRKREAEVSNKIPLGENLCIWIVAILVLQIIYWVGVVVYFHGPGDADQHWANAGTYGDMFGGLTCLFSGLAFAGLIVTIRQQRRELKMQVAEMERTRDEFKKQTEQFEIQTKQFSEQYKINCIQVRTDDIYRRLGVIRELIKEVKYTRNNYVITTAGEVINKMKPVFYTGNDALSVMQSDIFEKMKILFSEKSLSAGQRKTLELFVNDMLMSYFTCKPFLVSVNGLLEDVSEYFSSFPYHKARFEKLILGCLPDGAKELMCLFRGRESESKYIDELITKEYITSADISHHALNKDKCRIFGLYLFNVFPLEEVREMYAVLVDSSYDLSE